MEETGGIYEDKIGSVSGMTAHRQLGDILTFMDQNEGGSLDYSFFRSPITGKIGPTAGMASSLLDAAMRYDVGFHIYDYNWWEAYQ